MATEFPVGTKFAAIHLARCSVGPLPSALTLGHELSVHTSPVMTLTAMDRERIGKDYADAFDRSNLVLVASRPSDTPGIMDAESQDLERRAYMLLYAIFMQGVPNFWPGVLTIGGRSGSWPASANRIALINDLYRNGAALPFRVTASSLYEAERAIPGFVEIFGAHGDFARLRRGLNGLVRGWKAQGYSIDYTNSSARWTD